MFGSGLGLKEQTICNLERGTIVTKVYSKKRPEKRKLFIRRETGQVWHLLYLLTYNILSNQRSVRMCALLQVLWIPIQGEKEDRNSFEGALEIREIHEIRSGKNSKEFEKWQDELKNNLQSCFVIFYGLDFKLRALSVVAFSPQERTIRIY